MHRNLISRIIFISTTLALATSGSALGQFDDDPVPGVISDLQTALVLNSNGDPIVNAAIQNATDLASNEIYQRVEDKRNARFFETVTRADRDAVALRARNYADDGVGLVVIDGGDSARTVGFVDRTPSTTIIDLGQPLPCVDADGRPDPTGECLGGASSLPANYSVVTFEVQDPAYLAGVIAASASRGDPVGIISGMADCDECNRYIQGFILGAQTVAPDIDIEIAYLADDQESLAFGDPRAAKTFAEAFIAVYQPEVLMPIAGGASIGMIEAACDAGILVVGTGIDVAEEHPELAECVLASITRDVEKAVRHSIYEFSTSDLPRVREAGLADEFVGLTDEWETRTLPVGVTDLYNEALSGLLSGSVDACPSDCGAPVGTAGSGAAGSDGGETVNELGADASPAPAAG